MKADTQFSRFEKIALIVIICISFLILIIFSLTNHTKTISQLNDLESGTYKIRGYVNNLRISDNTKFKISDVNSSINAIIFDKILINEGDIINAYCKLTIYNGEKECIINNYTLN